MAVEVRTATIEDFRGVLSSPYLGVFHNVPDRDVLDWIRSGDCQVQRYEPDDQLYKQGQLASGVPLTVVMEGGLFAIQHHYDVPQKNGEVREINLIVSFDAAGTLIGESEPALRDVPDHYLMRGGPTGTTIAKPVAVTQTNALQIYGETKLAVLGNKHVSWNLQRLYSIKISRRSARSNALELYRDMDTILAALFCRLARKPIDGGVGVSDDSEDQTKPIPDGYVRLKCKLREEILAQAINKDRTVVSAAMSKLRADDKFIYRSKGTILINKKLLDAQSYLGLTW